MPPRSTFPLPFGVPAALVLAALLSLAGCEGRDVEAALFLEDVAAGGGPSVLKRTRPPPLTREVRYAVDGRKYVASLVAGPGSRAERDPFLVLLPGAAPGGRHDPRLRALADSFARVGFRVLIPENRRLRRLQVRSEDVVYVADAVRHVGRTRGPKRRIGLAGISYAVGPAVLAALRPDLRDRIGFVIGIGGYYDLTAVVTFFTTGKYRSDARAKWKYRAPNAYGRWVFAASNIDYLESARDRTTLRAITLRKRADPKAPIADLVGELGPEGRRVMALMTNRDPERVAGLIGGLPEAARAQFRALDLKGRDFSGLRARLILIHGRDDPIIPHTESIRLARAAGTDRAALFVIDALRHVRLASIGSGDAKRLLSAAKEILKARDELR